MYGFGGIVEFSTCSVLCHKVSFSQLVLLLQIYTVIPFHFFSSLTFCSDTGGCFPFLQ